MKEKISAAGEQEEDMLLCFHVEKRSGLPCSRLLLRSSKLHQPFRGNPYAIIQRDEPFLRGGFLTDVTLRGTLARLAPS